MHTDERREALQQLDHAWKYAAVGATEQAEQYVCRALGLLDHAVAQRHGPRIFVQMVQRHIEEGRAAITQSDLLGAMLAFIVALNVLQQMEPQEQADDWQPPQPRMEITTRLLAGLR
jgi:hypothetical protein